MKSESASPMKGPPPQTEICSPTKIWSNNSWEESSEKLTASSLGFLSLGKPGLGLPSGAFCHTLVPAMSPGSVHLTLGDSAAHSPAILLF